MPSKTFVDIPFGPYMPDFGGAPNQEMPGYLTDAVGVRLTPNGYRGQPTFADMSSGATIGASTNFKWEPAFFENFSSRHFFALNQADAKIYESTDDGVTWADSTPAAGSAPTMPGDFFSFGTDVIYVCTARAPIKRAIASAAGTDFTDLGGSPPVARCGAQVREHVVLGGLTATSNYAVRWSAIGNHEDWPTPGTADARSKEAGTQSLPQSLGFVRGIIGGEKIGIVVQEQGLTRMTYVGGDEVYAFDTYESKVGFGFTRTSKFCSDGTLWYWYNDSGFFATDGYSVSKLDSGKIEDAVFNDLLGIEINKTLPIDGRCQCAYDPHRGLVIFGTQVRTHQLLYSPRDGSFVFMNQPDVTGPFVGRQTNLTTFNIQGPTVYNINETNRKLQMLSADGATVAMQTGYMEIDPGYRFQFQGAHLLGRGAGAYTLAYKIAATTSACDIATTGFTSMTAAALGEKDTARDSGQYIAFQITGTGSEAHLVRGIRVYFERVEPAP